MGGDAQAYTPENVQDPSNNYAGRAGGGGFGPGYEGTLFANLGSVSYTIANSTVVGNTAVPGKSFAFGPDGGYVFTYGTYSFGGGVDDAVIDSPVDLQPLDNVVLYSTIVAENTTVSSPTVASPGPDIIGGRSYGQPDGPKGHNLIGIRDNWAPELPAERVCWRRARAERQWRPRRPGRQR